MRIHILGTGAMACLFGARLSKVADVALAGTWREGIAAVLRNGIVLETAEGEESFRVRAVRLGTPLPAADLVLVLVKTWQTAGVAGEVSALAAPGAHVLTLQNGLGNVELLGARALLGVTAQGATLLGPGRVRPGGDGPTHIAGPEEVAELFRAAGLEAHAVDPGMGTSLTWGKLAVNAGINALGALGNVPNGVLLARPEARSLMERAAEEVAAVARAKGILLPFADAAAEARRVAAATASNRSSMLQDVLRGAPTEIDSINGAVVREGARLGVPTPVNEELFPARRLPDRRVKVVTTVPEVRAACSPRAGSLGLVPTMGALHAGHLSLAMRAQSENDQVAVSIFVNPAQFDEARDLAAYPRSLESDLGVLESLGVDIVWTPSPGDVYPAGFQTWVTVEEVSGPLEGARRPGHFRGVATVVAKLLNVFGPDRAYFGQKDAQQVAVIRRMVRDLAFPVDVVVCPTVREVDGLALSSRNVYLGPEERRAATVIHRSLAAVRAAFASGERDANRLRAILADTVACQPLARPEYFSVADAETLAELERVEGAALVSLAVRLGTTRLIDNILLGGA